MATAPYTADKVPVKRFSGIEYSMVIHQHIKLVWSRYSSYNNYGHIILSRISEYEKIGLFGLIIIVAACLMNGLRQ